MKFFSNNFRKMISLSFNKILSFLCLGFVNAGNGVIRDPTIVNAFDFLQFLKEKKKPDLKKMAPIDKFVLSLEIGIYLTVSTLIYCF